MAIQLRRSSTKILILFTILTVCLQANFLKEAYDRVTGKTKSALNVDRKNDLNFVFIDPKCCCNNKILSLFRKETKKFENRVNPATDTLITSLSKEIENSFLLFKELKNEKVANGIYSFKDRNVYVPNTYQLPEIPNKDGCVPLDFNKEEDRKYYLDNIINRFESQGSYSAHNDSGAYGRYQFTRTTGALYCAKVGNNCCAYWHSDTPKGRECQDAMFKKFTIKNANDIVKSGVPINSCTIYIAHQQGVGGLNWLRGGSYPASFSTLKKRIRSNVPKKYYSRVDAATTDDELRQIYREAWSNKFGGDIMANIGSTLPVEDFTYNAYLFNKQIDDIKKLYREGILKEQIHINYEVKDSANAK